MGVSSSVPSSSADTDLLTLLKQLQHDTLVFSLPGLYAAAVIALLARAQFDSPSKSLIFALACLALAGGIWLLRKWHGTIASWLLVLGGSALNVWAVTWGGVEQAAYLLLLPAGLSTLVISRSAGLGLAAFSTAWLALLPAETLGDLASSRAALILLLWGMMALFWLTLRPFLETARWAWFASQRSFELLDQARQYQRQLQETLKDLQDTNLQLTLLNRQVDGLRHEAEEARRVKEEFVANISHELRTPINMIVGFSEAIVESPKTYGRVPPALLADLNVILRNSQHLSSLINDVLDLSQIEAQQMALTKERASLYEIVEAATVAVRPLFDSKNLALEANLPADLPEIWCDRTRIREVLLNLLSNAGRFTQQGSVQIVAQCAQHEVRVEVRDTGPGIASADLARLFQPFQQLDSSIRRQYGGTGLGLSISKHFVEQHGGKIWAESEAGRGTTFVFTLPLHLPPAAVQSPARWINPAWEFHQRTRPMSIQPPEVHPRFVVLEPEDTLARLLKRYLADAEIVAVRTVEQAQRELAAYPALALLINGSSVAQTLMTLNSSLPEGTPVLVCDVPGSFEIANRLGVDGYLTKPISRQALLDAIEQRHLSGNTLLVADDEPDALRLYRRILADAPRQYRVLTASNGEQALALLRAERPALLLTDLVMPEMDGFDLLAAKNADAELRSIPTLVLSARDPAGQLIVSKALAVTRQGGLSIPQLLAGITALSQVLSPLGADPAPPTD